MAGDFYIDDDSWTQYQLQKLDDFTKTLVLPNPTPAPASTPSPTATPAPSPNPSPTPFPSLDQVLSEAGVKDASPPAAPTPPARDDGKQPSSAFPSFDQVLAGAGITPTVPNPSKLAGEAGAVASENVAGQAFGGSAQDTPATDLSQFGDAQLTTEEAYAACGLAAAVRFAQRFGRNPTLREATNLAKEVGWTTAQGMGGSTPRRR